MGPDLLTNPAQGKYNRDIFMWGYTFNVTREQGIGFIEEMLKRKQSALQKQSGMTSLSG
jgi:hypothetical protein